MSDSPALPVPGAPLDALLDHAPCGFLSLADDGRILVVNTTLLEMLGMPRDAVEGRRIDTILPAGSRLFHQTHLFPLIRLHGRAEEIFLLLRTGTGEDIGVLLNAVRRTRDGAPVTDCVLVRVRERQRFEGELLNARKVAEEAEREIRAHASELERVNFRLEEQAIELELSGEELQVMNEDLEERSRELDRLRIAAEEATAAKSRFLAMMSHELRTPLNAIAGYVQLIEMGIHGPVTDRQAAALDRIARSQRHLLRLINEILNLARVESGEVVYHTEPVRVEAVLAEVTPMIEPQAAAAGLQLSIDPAPGLIVMADPEKLTQILINVLGNAVKFTPRDGRIAVIAGPVDAGERVHISVRDTGRGIPAARLHSIFTPFVQVDTSPNRLTEGTGLGLAISRDLARGMGGDLTVESVEGEGSTFTLSLPGPPAPT